MSNKRKTKSVENTQNTSKQCDTCEQPTVYKAKYPVVLNSGTEHTSERRRLFGLVVDKSESTYIKQEIKLNTIKSETISVTYRYVFGLFKYLKSRSYDVYTYEREVVNSLK